ncbi:MAG: hypothetical protein WDN04_12565 [Rhodospirillales bacterium]
MPQIEDRLRPRDGLNNHSIAFARMTPQARGGAEFVFNISDSMQPVSELTVIIPARGQGLDQMMVEAHDAIIDILRQLIYRADKSRANYERFTHVGALCRDEELSEVEFL